MRAVLLFPWRVVVRVFQTLFIGLAAMLAVLAFLFIGSERTTRLVSGMIAARPFATAVAPAPTSRKRRRGRTGG